MAESIETAAQPSMNTQAGVDSAVVTAALAAATGAMAAFTTSANEITAKLNSVFQDVQKVAASNVNQADITTTANVSGAYDMYDDPRRAAIVNNKLALSMAENADALMKEYLKYTSGVWARSLDHFCSVNPEVPPKAAPKA